jgi:hypothetical protein
VEFKISSELLDKIGAYLGTKPYQEVAVLISEIVQLVQKQKKEVIK